MTPADLQARIDAMAYPPTHTYRLIVPLDIAPPNVLNGAMAKAAAMPTGILAERWSILGPIFRTFNAEHTNGGHFLDVGCSKGFFSLAARSMGFTVTAIDTSAEAVALCRDLGINAAQYSFREWPPPEHRFDLVFAGNVNHYCYQEAGWSWVRKLAAVTADNGTVIIEGPVGVIRDILFMTPRMAPAQLVDFTWTAFQREMTPWFELVSKVPTVGYTPDRHITVWRRKPMAVIGRAGYGPEPFETIAKMPVMLPPSLHRSLEFARTPFDVPRLHDLFDKDGAFCGWVEPRVTPDARFAPGWRQREYSTEMRAAECAAWYGACLRNAELARMGMVDVDMGPANWFNDGGGWRTFDKNSIWPIATLDEGELGPTGRFLRTLDWASNPVAIPVALRTAIADALASRNSVTVERAFIEVAEEMGR